METLIGDLLSLPTVVLGAILGALGGIVGVVAGLTTRSRTIRVALVTLCVVVAVGAGEAYIDELKRSYGYVPALEEIRKNPLFETIFHYHPRAEAELADDIRSVMRTTPDSGLSQAMQAKSAAFVAKYFQASVINASDTSVHAFLRYNAYVMRNLKDDPADCVAFYLGTPFNAAVMAPDWLTELSRLKAEIIKSAETDPSPPTRDAGIEATAATLRSAYQERTLPLDDLRKVGLVADLPRVEGCRIATEFIETLSDLDDALASHVFKNLMLTASGK